MKNHDYSPSYKHIATIALSFYAVGRLSSQSVYYFLGLQKLLLQVTLQAFALQYLHFIHEPLTEARQFPYKRGCPFCSLLHTWLYCLIFAANF